MEQLRQIGYAICVTLVMTALLLALVPSGSMEKVVRFAVHLFLLLSLLLPFVKEPMNLSVSDFIWGQSKTTESLNQLTDEQILRGFQRSLQIQAKAVLQKHGMVPEKVFFEMNVGADRSIDITELTIELRESDRETCDDAVTELNQLFGLTAKVIFI